MQAEGYGEKSSKPFYKNISEIVQWRNIYILQTTPLNRHTKIFTKNKETNIFLNINVI